MIKLEDIRTLPNDRKIYFASDFHLGVPDKDSSLQRERKIIDWLNMVSEDAYAIILLGDLFDFWFEYKHTIPKGFTRIQGKLVELVDKGMNIYLFTGNHDMWMFDYFPEELGIPVYRHPIKMNIEGVSFLVGHGDGLGPGDFGYKLIKKIFANRLCQWAFRWIHPDIGIGMANYWSNTSRESASGEEMKFDPKKDFIYNFCLESEKTSHYDYYIFGHRHLKIDIEVGSSSRYINTGDWISGSNFAVFNGKYVELKEYES